MIVQRYRTPSRSRSRSATPVHWKKEEARVIKLSQYEKAEAERKQKEEDRKWHDTKLAFDNKGDKDYKLDQENGRSVKEVDYNALDYEQENQSDDEHEVSKKQVRIL